MIKKTPRAFLDSWGISAAITSPRAVIDKTHRNLAIPKLVANYPKMVPG
jgi:hypothetical protein